MVRYILYLLVVFPFPLYATAQVNAQVQQYQQEAVDLLSLVLGVLIGIVIFWLLFNYAIKYLKYLKQSA